MADDDTGLPLDEQVLDVYASRDGGWWNPADEHAELSRPIANGWGLLPSYRCSQQPTLDCSLS